MHLHLGGCLLVLILVVAYVVGGWEAVGRWVVYGPLTIIGVVALALMVPRFVRLGRKWRQHRLDAPRVAALNLKRKTAESEAALGIAVPTSGRCPQCNHPLVAGARFCGHCRSAVAAVGSGRTSLPVVLCPQCAERQPDEHVVYCFSCGADLAEPVRSWQAWSA
jgi:hypothetical protein